MSKLNFENKYKDRTPEETVSIIKKYFTDQGFTITELKCQETEVGTWSSRVIVKYNNKFIVGANGKAVNKEFCMASAYGELYERFCNRMYGLSNYPLGNIILNKSKELFDYYLDPNEKQLDFFTAFNNSNIGLSFLDSFKNSTKEIKNFFDTVLNNNYIGVPYKNAYNEMEVEYLDPRIVLFLSGSSGMAGGNNFYEAYVQGMSEMYEHYVSGSYCVKEQEKYYYLNLNNITNPKLKNMLDKIKIDNHVYIIDFSYNFNVPVLGILLINKKSHSIILNLGSSPIFDIALERVITEVYQGRWEGFNFFKTYGLHPFKENYEPKIKDLTWQGSQTFIKTFPEFIFNKLHEIDAYNNNIFLNGEYSNYELYLQMKKYNDLNNFKPYYYNCSGCKDVYAIKIFDINMPHLEIHFDGLINQLETNDFIECQEYYNIIHNYLYNQELDINNFTKLNKKLTNLGDRTPYYCFILFSTYLYWENTREFGVDDLGQLSNLLLYSPQELVDYKNDNFISKFDANTNIYKQLNKFVILFRYINSKLYDINELINIFKFLQIDYTIEDLQNLYNPEYWVKRIIFADLNDYINGNYDNYIIKIASYNREVLV